LLPSGTILDGTYRIVHLLAEGGCGEVYLATHTRLPGEVAVKVLHRSFLRDEEARSRFRREAEITSAMRHPHIVQVFDFNVTPEGIPYLVMELLDGQLLTKRLAASGPLAPHTAVHIIEQIAGALQVAHARGIVHRDLKPDNVILMSVDGQDDFVKLVDFGISQASWRPRVTCGDARVVGTPQFMAPEQARGLREEIDARTDQFSLAAIAYTLLTGYEPFWSDDLTAVLYQVVHEMPIPTSRRAPWLTSAVDAVLERGLAKSSGDRYPDIMAFASALRDVVLDSSAPSAEPSPARVDSATATRESITVEVAQAERPGIFAPVFAMPPRVLPVSQPPARAESTARPVAPARRPSRRGGALVAALALAAVAGMLFTQPRARASARASWRDAQGQVTQLVNRAARATARDAQGQVTQLVNRAARATTSILQAVATADGTGGQEPSGSAASMP
jgi:serine/threonine-protein kinase